MSSPFTTVCKIQFKLNHQMILVPFHTQLHAGDIKEHLIEVYVNSNTYSKNVVAALCMFQLIVFLSICKVLI